MAECTNIYALQEGRTNFHNTDTNEIQTLFALHIIIGCLNKFPTPSMYWDSTLCMHAFLDNMSRGRFFQLPSCLHLVNRLDRPADCTDKHYKVWLNASNLKHFGLGASVVLQLSERITSKGHKLFYNFFSSYALLQILKSKSIFAAGTIRVNRFVNPLLIADRDMKKKPRGYSDEVTSLDGDVVVKDRQPRVKLCWERNRRQS
jgi:hypothetical protein